MRLSKLLSSRGYCPRRSDKLFLAQNLVLINGQRAENPAVDVDPKRENVIINGKPLRGEESVYYLLNKPLGVVSTTTDPRGRITVTQLIPESSRVYPVGRLDQFSSGALLLTNDGEVTNRMLHPRYHIPKTYHLKILGNLSDAQINPLRLGVEIDGYLTQPANVNLIKKTNLLTFLEMTIFEGRNRQIRKMCEKLKIELLSLHRVSIGNIKLGNLHQGKYRKLTEIEVTKLKQTLGL